MPTNLLITQDPKVKKRDKSIRRPTNRVNKVVIHGTNYANFEIVRTGGFMTTAHLQTQTDMPGQLGPYHALTMP